MYQKKRVDFQTYCGRGLLRLSKFIDYLDSSNLKLLYAYVYHNLMIN